MQRVTTGLAIFAALAFAAVSVPATAQGWHHDDHGHYDHRDWHHDHDWHGGYVYGAPPPVVYTPSPYYYAPPPAVVVGVPGLSINIR